MQLFYRSFIITIIAIVALPAHGMNTIAPINPKLYTVAKLLPLPKDLQNIVFEYAQELRIRKELQTYTGGEIDWAGDAKPNLNWSPPTEDVSNPGMITTSIETYSDQNCYALARYITRYLPRTEFINHYSDQIRSYVLIGLTRQSNQSITAGNTKTSFHRSSNTNSYYSTLTHSIIDAPNNCINDASFKITTLHKRRLLKADRWTTTLSAPVNSPVWDTDTYPSEQEEYIRAAEQNAYTKTVASVETARLQKAKNKTNCCVIS